MNAANPEIDRFFAGVGSGAFPALVFLLDLVLGPHFNLEVDELRIVRKGVSNACIPLHAKT